MKSRPRKKSGPAQFVIVWEFHPRAGKQREFEKAYGRHGVWGNFFRRDAGYVRTELLRAGGEALRYFTIDVWQTREAYERFRKHYVAEYAEIDTKCEPLTESESKIGEFDSVASAKKAIADAKAVSVKTALLQLRTATIDDVESMITIERGAQSAAHWAESVYRRLFEAVAPPRIALVVEKKPPSILGFVIARIAGSECEIENIVVEERLRRSGLGSQLIESLVQAARDWNVQRIFLEVRESNAAARGFYEKCGFEKAGRRSSYYADPSEDAVLYSLSVS